MEKRFCDRCEAIIERDYFKVEAVHYGHAMSAETGKPSDVIVLKSDLCAACYQTAREYLRVPTFVPAETV